MSQFNKICSSWPVFSTNYYPMLKYRKYDDVPINENCEFIAIIKITVNNIPYFAKIYIKYNENVHIVKELKNDYNKINWEIVEIDNYFILVVKGSTTSNNDYIQIKLENYRNIGFVELLNYKNPINIDTYEKVNKLFDLKYILSSCAALKYKKLGNVTVYNQQYSITKFFIIQNDLQRDSELYGEFILRIINGKPIFVLGSHSEDFNISLINFHIVNNNNNFELYWQNNYSSITNKINVEKLIDINSSSNYFTLENIQESIDSITPTISLFSGD